MKGVLPQERGTLAGIGCWVAEWDDKEEGLKCSPEFTVLGPL